jgi:hypothetical protein
VVVERQPERHAKSVARHVAGLQTAEADDVTGIIPDPQAIEILGQQILNCICTTLDDTKIGVPDYRGCPPRACTAFSATPVWELITCDQLTVAVGAIYPSSAFPRQDSTVPDCAPTTIVAEVNATLVRCLTGVMGSNGEAPSCEAIAADARTLGMDMLGIMAAMNCCLPQANGTRRKRRAAVTRIANLPEQGGYAGTSMSAVVDLGIGCACGEPYILVS